MPLHAAKLDHVAVAVTDVEAAVAMWLDRGAVEVGGGTGVTFRSHQVRFGNGAKLEMIGPGNGDAPSFIDGFLARFGPGTIHHVTVKVDPASTIHDAVRELDADGIGTVDVKELWPHWHEAFVRPSTVGGLVAQVAWSDLDDGEWAETNGVGPLAEPAADAPVLHEVRLGHEDLTASAAVWTSLGATLTHDDGAFTARWAGAPMAVRVEQHVTRGPHGIVVEGIAPAGQTALTPTVLRPR